MSDSDVPGTGVQVAGALAKVCSELAVAFAKPHPARSARNRCFLPQRLVLIFFLSFFLINSLLSFFLLFSKTNFNTIQLPILDTNRCMLLLQGLHKTKLCSLDCKCLKGRDHVLSSLSSDLLVECLAHSIGFMNIT